MFPCHVKSCCSTKLLEWVDCDCGQPNRGQPLNAPRRARLWLGAGVRGCLANSSIYFIRLPNKANMFLTKRLVIFCE